MLTLLLSSCTAMAQPAAITVGIPPLEQDALLYVAAAQGYFARNHIDVSIKNFDSGPTSIAAMRSGKVDIAETAEFPFVESVMRGEHVSVIATNDRFENDYIVGLRDRGITRVHDLKGKRIGVTFHTITQFFLGRFLTLHGISLSDVTLVNVQPSQFANSFQTENIDAVVAWQPFVNRIVSGHEGSFAVWSVQSSQPVYGLLVGDSAWLNAHQTSVKNFLRSLAEAQTFLVRHPPESQAIVAKRLSESTAYVSSVWQNHQFSLSLDYSLVAAMEDEARWLIVNRLSPTTVVPDFEKSLYLKGLESAMPIGVNLMG